MKKITGKKKKKFEEHLIHEEKSKATVDKYVHDVTAFAAWLGSAVLNKMKVLEYKEYLLDTYAPASVNSVLSSLNGFFDFCEAGAFKVKNLKIQRRIFLRKEKELTKAEYERLLCAAKAGGNRKLYLLMQTICSTGIRVSELRFISIEALRSGQATINLKGKMRVIMLPQELCKMLKKYAQTQKIRSGSIFVTKNGRPLDRSNIWKCMKALCKTAGVDPEKVFPHNLRHLFARTYYNLRKDIVRLADILGHSSVNTTRIYTMDSGEICRKQIQRLGLLRC